MTVARRSIGIGVVFQRPIGMKNSYQRIRQITDLELLEINGIRLAASQRSLMAHGGEPIRGDCETHRALVNAQV